MTRTDIFIIEMNIARYREMLRRVMEKEKRAMIEELLAEAESDLRLVAESERQS